MTTLSYGNGISCELDAGRITHLRVSPEAASDQMHANLDVIAEMRAALAEPMDYPPLSDATVPGDKAVIALAQGVVCPLEVVEGAFLALRDAGVESDFISVIVPKNFAREDQLRQSLKSRHSEDCLLLKHDPDDTNATAMIGVTRNGQPIRINRLLSDADVVLSIGSSSEDTSSSFNGLFPRFSDRETINRVEAPLATEDSSLLQERQQEILEAGWLLGVGLVVQIIPGLGDKVAQILAGETKKVFAESERIYRELWSCPTAEKADLVIATLTGDASEQTWENLARVLRAASPLLSEGGSIAICSEIDQLAGQSFQAFVDHEDYDVISREIVRDQHGDSGAAWQVCQALRRGSVYLLSHLPDAWVESLGITPIAIDQELDRLAETHRHTIVLEDAQRLLPIEYDNA